MRHRYLNFAPLLLLLGMIFSGAAAPPRVAAQSAAPAPSQLDQLGWFVGGTWTTQEPSDDSSSLLIKMICRWSNNKKAIVYTVSFISKGKEFPQYDGMFVWHPAKGKVILLQVNPKGEFAEGELTINGKEMDETVHVSHLDGGQHFLKAHYTRITDDSFRFQASFRPSESVPWQDVLDLIYTRQPDAPAK